MPAVRGTFGEPNGIIDGIAGEVAYVLGGRPMETVKEGEAARFEAVSIALP